MFASKSLRRFELHLQDYMVCVATHFESILYTQTDTHSIISLSTDKNQRLNKPYTQHIFAYYGKEVWFSVK